MGSFIVCLAHFCELHGPSIIICTQSSLSKDKSNLLLPPTAKRQDCASCKLDIPDDHKNLVTEFPSELKDSTQVYVSNHYPNSQKRYTSLTKLVMKALSVETISDIQKPMFYGDALNGYCMNKIFKIKDTSSRGAERKYALMVVSEDESQLLSNWDIISIYLKEYISSVKSQVETALEFPVNRSESDLNANSMGILDNKRYLRRSMIRPKSLVELTNDSQVFIKYHLWAVELLKDVVDLRCIKSSPC